ncbi:uncharacterized protein LOC126609192 [Malus sylvestris]|uniref:uncharacterized protein LOC126609192 n=1 Tax=Malus sylvestris TaxID=3752 RepID=UPI0021ACACFD|nr:uncharacterized protein LOC126609192 [Malus sylvestris]
MRRELFEGILNAVVNHDHYFARKIDVVGRQSLSPHQKLTSAFRMLANGCSTDSTDEYCRLAESTAIENLKRFCQAIQAIYGATYLRKPTREDLKRLLRKADKRGFPGMIGSLDCMHWELKNCPTSWAGQFKGRHNKPTIMLEAVASYDTWIWHAFFGSPGSNNDINVLWSSPLFDEVVNGWAPEFRYKVNVEDEYIEFEEDSDEDVNDDQLTHARAIARDVEYLAPTTYETRHDRITLGEYMRRLNRIQALQIHDTLRKDLVEHVWRREGER